MDGRCVGGGWEVDVSKQSGRQRSAAAAAVATQNPGFPRAAAAHCGWQIRRAAERLARREPSRQNLIRQHYMRVITIHRSALWLLVANII